LREKTILRNEAKLIDIEDRPERLLAEFIPA
jgi:hypothetical protein